MGIEDWCSVPIETKVLPVFSEEVGQPIIYVEKKPCGANIIPSVPFIAARIAGRSSSVLRGIVSVAVTDSEGLKEGGVSFILLAAEERTVGGGRKGR